MCSALLAFGYLLAYHEFLVQLLGYSDITLGFIGPDDGNSLILNKI